MNVIAVTFLEGDTIIMNVILKGLPTKFIRIVPNFKYLCRSLKQSFIVNRKQIYFHNIKFWSFVDILG